ncbi:unnamed protein product [Moneuplotes crassus]|uniref:Uncharacterized protein n=1 Tax=Euplotes crassus TaxID=5936 RepID=A0AAD2D143_EUPCR|nr:unnamed protein product [Moneuplotes crassus]
MNKQEQTTACDRRKFENAPRFSRKHRVSQHKHLSDCKTIREVARTRAFHSNNGGEKARYIFLRSN